MTRAMLRRLTSIARVGRFVDECLHLTYTSNEEDQVVIVWRDQDSDDGDHFEFVCDSKTKGDLFDKFDITARRCQYERKYRKAWSNASNQDLEAFDFDPDPVAAVPSGKKKPVEKKRRSTLVSS